MIELNQENFGTLAICALRYCRGRQTYMPSLVQGICKHHIKEVSDKDLFVMINDCDFQRKYELYGDENIDKPGWLEWEKMLLEEKKRRKEAE